MKRIYHIAVATVILSAVGLSGAWFLSGSPAEAGNSPGNDGISISSGSSGISPGSAEVMESDSSPQPTEEVASCNATTGAAIVEADPGNKMGQVKAKADKDPADGSVRKYFTAQKSDSISVAGGSLAVAEGRMLRPASLSISAVDSLDLPELDFAMCNVTGESDGYRFLPHGTHFTDEGATIRLKYDRTKIPSGYTEDDIHTYYYDTEQGHWVALDRVKVDKELACVVSKTTHFTDMINGVIQAPESPETEGFAPTMMNDIKAADPTAKLNIIAPPSANNRGSANLQYAFEMPPARNGMAPSLGISYNSDGGNGWLGHGWDLSVPSITLDTRWGVPRYNTEEETETYSLSGSMLSTMDDNGAMSVAHRGDRIARKADRQFYTRQGGDFSRIIRKGDSPANYYWEVTDKQGVVYTYGGEGAVLKGTITDINGNTREVISEWKLRRVEETHGDWIEYEYTAVDEPVRGGLTAKAIYLSKVSASNAEGDGPHTVVTLTGEKQKRQKTNNARYGYLTSSNRLLEKVSIEFMGEELRSYAFSYVDGAFHKDMLESVRQYDDSGKEFAFQTFDYYDDVQSGSGYVPFKSESETWNTHNDGLDAGFINPLQVAGGRFSDKPTALGGTTSTSISGSFYVGVGPMTPDAWKGNTGGGSYNYSSDNSKGLSTFVDINGDGLPDKVYRDGGALYYRPQLRSDDNEVRYGEPIKVRGISSFATTKSSTNSGGISAVVGYQAFTGVIGTDFSSTKTKTTEYFSDINGDGLVDLVSNGKVYFNHIEKDAAGNLVPTFTLSSADTPSPIIYSGKIDASVITIDPEEQQQLIASSPMQDIVRVWQAPKNGIVSISGDVSLIIPSGDYDAEEYGDADGVRVAIQKGSSELWNTNIPKGDATAHSAAVSGVSVNKGDRIYFRVQCGNEELSNGAFDRVKWSPVISYAGTEEIGPNGYSNVSYNPVEGAIYDVSTIVQIDEGKDFSINGHFVKPVTSDDVTVRVYAANDEHDGNGNPNPSYTKREVFSKTFGWDTAVDEDITAQITNADHLPNISFEITSTSNVAWPDIKWTPSVTYADSTNTNVNVLTGVHYVTYPKMLAEGSSKTFSATDSIIIVKPSITFSPLANVSGIVTLTAKSADGLIGKKDFTVTNGIFPMDSLALNPGANKIWFEYSWHGNLTDGNVTNVAVSVNRPAVLLPETVDAGLFAYGENNGFGLMYRGWGGFAYNAAEGRYASPINEALLKLPEDENVKLDPLTMPFTPIGTDQTTQTSWVGQRQDIYLTADEMGAARLAEQNVILTNPLENDVEITGLGGTRLQGTGAAAVTQVATNKSTVVQTGAMGITYSKANGGATTEVTMMDMNGDGYPDIIAGGTIQYTNSQGGLSGEKLGGLGNSTTDNESHTWGYGGNPVNSVSDIARTVSGSTQSEGGRKASLLSKFSISGSVPYNTDESVESYIDVNGDGLPDKVLSDKKVRLNMGYSFTEPIDWDLDRIQGGKSQGFNAGAGFGSAINKASGSFSAGVGITSSVAETEYSLMDVNSDGLPDKVWISGDQVTVSLNKGDSFDTPFVWNGMSSLNETISTSESVNAAFTISIPVIVCRIATNPGFSTGHSINRTTYSLQDVDGDGYLDIVESDKESELKVTRSAIGRTNMLKSVTNSIGGRFELDYAHSTPTYGLPGGKWVMSALTVDDGIHDDGPLMKTAFEYADGNRDRHERDFLGFGKVITKSLDTENGASVYRQAVQEFAVDNYYASGNLVASYVTDASGNKFTETVNEYDAYSVTANADNYSFAQKDVIYSDRASAFVPLRYTANKQYEGASDGVTISEAWNEYYLNGHHGELKSYRYSDKGSLGSNGSGAYDYATSIQYTSNSGKHIFGLPTNVTVTGGDGTMYHNVSATYNTNYPNHLTQVSQQLGNGTAVTDYKYDRYGNITQKTLPANATGQRMWYKYRYEPEMNMYVERIDDAWGYRSEAGNFDYRYGIALERRDLNNFYYETEIDNMGRVTKVRGPNELATGVPYIIAFEYKPKAEFGESGISAPAYAVTKHYDIQHPGDDLETVTFVDGFGRPVQVKKDGVVTTASKGSGASDQTVMIVSGRNVYDAFGRVAKAYYPTTEGMGGKTSFSTTFDNVNPTRTVYDVLDRALSVKLPDDSETTTEYSLDNGSNALVTTVTDALGNKQATHTNGSGKTVKSVQLSGPDGEIATSFEYDGIQRLVKVTDADENVTTSVYDMGDRRTEVNHPASGITSFTYDPLGNVLTKQTANMAEEGKMITYTYDYHRLTGINYPDHPENNVKYYYGGRNASYNRIGRLMMREDGTGAIEYFYGKMGEVSKTRRTLIVPNQAIATYVTQWTYDSHNRLIEMIYPDEEKVTYSYNLGGLLEKVRGEKSYGYDYITKLGYDKFEQRIYLKYCNGAETFYTYDNRRRLSNLAVNSGGTSIMDNAYTFDAVSNVLSVANNASLPQSGNAGGQMAHSYTYDGLYRLASATGTYTGVDSKSASYTLDMGYDNMHRITSKRQHLTQDNVQFNGTLNVGYDLSYTYSSEEGKKFQLESVKDVNYRTEETPEGNNVENGHVYSYDKNGNLVYVNTSRMMKDGHKDSSVGERKLIWDEENRLLSVDDNGFVSNYWYDADGERTVKTSGESDQVYVNGVFSGGSTNTAKFSLYVSPYLVANQGGRYTKHIYAGSQRIVSKVGDFASYGSDPRRIEYAGSETDGLSVDYKSKYTAQQQVIKDHYTFFDVPYNGTDNNNYADGEGFCCNDGTLEAAQAKAMRKVQSRAVAKSFKDPDNYENLQFFYHPDHLGSSSFITNLDGEVVQHIEYVPFGEVFIEERNSVWNTPYLFNAKEFDEETGLYYYGARYYESRLSLWMSVDPLSSYNPFNNENYIDGEHNGGVYNNMNLGIYSYCYQNPIKLKDPDGRQVVAVHGTNSDNSTWKQRQQITDYAAKKFGNTKGYFGFNWSGGNYASSRTKAAYELISKIKEIRPRYSPTEPITIVGHSHGGNVGIETINIMVNMPEFDGIKINLITINTPVRSDYQLSDKAKSRVGHINIYDTKDPIQVIGGNSNLNYERFNGIYGPSIGDIIIGEMGPAGRTFPEPAINIPVDNPQGFFKQKGIWKVYNKEWHNSHNRTEDWVDK